ANISRVFSWTTYRAATTNDNPSAHPLTEHVVKRARGPQWVLQARARVRYQGHIFHTEMFVVPVKDYAPTPADTAELHKQIEILDWKLQDTVIAVVEELDAEQVPPSES